MVTNLLRKLILIPVYSLSTPCNSETKKRPLLFTMELSDANIYNYKPYNVATAHEGGLGGDNRRL